MNMHFSKQVEQIEDRFSGLQEEIGTELSDLPSVIALHNHHDWDAVAEGLLQDYRDWTEANYADEAADATLITHDLIYHMALGNGIDCYGESLAQSVQCIHQSEGQSAYLDPQELKDHVYEQLEKYWEDAGKEGYLESIDFDKLYQQAMDQYKESGLEGVSLAELNEFSDGPVMLMAERIENECIDDILAASDLGGFTTL